MMCNPVFLKKHVDLICHERRCRLTVSIPHSVRSRRRIDTHSTFTFSSVISTSRRSMGSNGIGPSDWCGGPRFHRDPPRPIKGGYSQIIQTCDRSKPKMRQLFSRVHSNAGEKWKQDDGRDRLWLVLVSRATKSVHLVRRTLIDFRQINSALRWVI